MASVVLGRPVPVAERYPHICGVTVHATRSGTPYRYSGRDCAACHEQLAKDHGGRAAVSHTARSETP